MLVVRKVYNTILLGMAFGSSGENISAALSPHRRNSRVTISRHPAARTLMESTIRSRTSVARQCVVNCSLRLKWTRAVLYTKRINRNVSIAGFSNRSFKMNLNIAISQCYVILLCNIQTSHYYIEWDIGGQSDLGTIPSIPWSGIRKSPNFFGLSNG